MMEGIEVIKTLEEFFYELGSLSYDNGDYRVVKDKFRDNEIKKFVDCFLPGTEIRKDGMNGKPLVLRGAANTDKGTTGEEKLDFHGYQFYDYSDTDGNWVLLTFPDLSSLEAHLLSDSGYLNYYSTQMFVFEDGVEKPFEIMFNGDNDTIIGIDKDQLDSPLEMDRLKERIWVRWRSADELNPLTEQDIEAYKRSLKEK